SPTAPCGAGVPSVTVTSPSSNPVDAYSLNTVSALVNDPDLNSCAPSRFHHNTYSFAWSISTMPPGGRAQLSSLTGPTTTFQAFAAATGYQVHAVVTSSNGQSSDPNQASSFRAFNVDVCGSRATIIDTVVTREHNGP